MDAQAWVMRWASEFRAQVQKRLEDQATIVAAQRRLIAGLEARLAGVEAVQKGTRPGVMVEKTFAGFGAETAPGRLPADLETLARHATPAERDVLATLATKLAARHNPTS